MNDAFFAAGKDWELGPDWPGMRCGAKTRKGTPCQNPAMKVLLSDTRPDPSSGFEKALRASHWRIVPFVTCSSSTSLPWVAYVKPEKCI